jgi:uncharacterized membrane protein YccC
MCSAVPILLCAESDAQNKTSSTGAEYNRRMSSPASSLSSFPTAVSSTFWSRESASIKQGAKTGLAAFITYVIYVKWRLPQGYWAVFAAMVVTQANLGASWKAALYRVIGSTCGALAAAIVFPVLGKGPIGAGIALFLLASLFGYLSALHTAFTAAGITAAVILVFGGQGDSWHAAWLRVLYTTDGAVIAFVVGALFWPVRAREGLRLKIAGILDGSAELYRAITAAALQGVDNEQQMRELDLRLHDLRHGITQQMEETRSELAFSRFNQEAYQRMVQVGDQIRRRLTAMAEDCPLYVHAQVSHGLLPSMATLTERTAEHFAALAETVRHPEAVLDSADLERAVAALDGELAKLREQRVTSPFALDRMLPFWALVFNLREVALDLKELESALPQLG